MHPWGESLVWLKSSFILLAVHMPRGKAAPAIISIGSSGQKVPNVRFNCR